MSYCHELLPCEAITRPAIFIGARIETLPLRLFRVVIVYLTVLFA